MPNLSAKEIQELVTKSGLNDVSGKPRYELGFTLNDPKQGEFTMHGRIEVGALLTKAPDLASTALAALERVDELEKEAAYWRDRCHVIDPDLK